MAVGALEAHGPADLEPEPGEELPAHRPGLGLLVVQREHDRTERTGRLGGADGVRVRRHASGTRGHVHIYRRSVRDIAPNDLRESSLVLVGHSQPMPSWSRSNFGSQPGSPGWMGAAPWARTSSQFV